MSIAEDSGLILQIGHLVFREACRHARVWQDAGLPPLPMAVNVSAVEFRDKDFVERVRKTLSETGLQPQYLELELTEGTLADAISREGLALSALPAVSAR